MKKGPLVKVELQPGRYVKMYEADAIAQGLIQAPSKSKPAARDKMRRPKADKVSRAAEQAESPEVNHRAEGTKPDSIGLKNDPAVNDFTTIDGVGPATARALAAHGIETFEELLDVGDLDYLNAPLNAVIEKWRAGADSSLGGNDESGDV